MPERLLDKNHADRTARAKQLTALLERYERILDLRERRETIRRLLDARGQMNFQYELQAGQLPQVDRELAAYGSIDSADALALLDRNEDELLRYLYYTSARCIRRLEEPKYNDLMSIVHSPDTDKERVTQFNKYLSEPENLKKLLRVFPIVATTCISAHRLGDPEPSFDMVIMDEASQCSTAMSLVPILRGASLMLVGDPQQLSPVILLDPADNRTLRRRYGVTQEYDYIENSIYKCFLACDAVSDETLLSYHYRQPQDHRVQQSQILQPQAAHCQPRDRPHAARLCGRAQRHHRREKHRPAGGAPHRGIPDRAPGQAGGHHHAVCEAARRHRGHAAREAL